MKSKIVIIDEKLKHAFENLKTSKSEDYKLYSWLNKTFDILKENPFSGIQLPKRLIPKIYLQKYKIKNLWKYNLPEGWRLVYSVEQEDIIVISIILEWLDHKSYEKRFKY